MELDFDPDVLRAKYRAERERRIRPDGNRQYQRLAGDFSAYGRDPYADAEFTREPLHDRVEALVVGGGFGGLLAGARLRQAGVKEIRVVEKGGDFGGTWYWNRYPGIHCDIESYIYLPLLEELGHVPKWKYAPGEEIREHARAVARHFGLYDDACFQIQVTELRWDEGESEWVVATDRGDRMRARYVVVSSGTLSEAKLPGIPGSRPSAGTPSTPAAGTTTTPAATPTGACTDSPTSASPSSAPAPPRSRSCRTSGRTPRTCTSSSAPRPPSTYAATGPPTRNGPSP